MTDKEEIWILKGYETFSEFGEKGLKVEQLAKAVGISKSSFYHHFSDLDIFVDRLLRFHLSQSVIIAGKEKIAKTINSDLINILLEHKTDLLFNRQLRINSNKLIYQETLTKSNQIIGKDFISLWLTDTNSNLNFQQAEGLIGLALENFFLQINLDSFNRQWLEAYFENLKRITRSFD
ncbi:TetR/AcrR family transcriptional regulator [Chryseobacterium takakiae]|uniref:Transcriptional regulator, TetR family n=1 Tax=Chryseobacterium takakiae TaxID=1302685 RepID=A0A1M4UQ51_9FLAO|nr:TetR/AcrR family transcriptional regulator [Chryseobacterium takakiae]SHE58809.1 transcriptional regulator, TetR family [Chryseobacterium takakiae]